MNRARPMTVTKVRQLRAGVPIHKPGQPIIGTNYVGQKAESAKKTARKASGARKALKKA